MKAARKKGICFVATFFFLVQSMIGCVASESSQSAFNATSDEMSSEVIATAVSTKTASPTTEPALTPDVITDEQLLASWSELYNTLCSEFVDYSETAANCIPDKKSITWNSFIYPWRNNMEELKTSYDELAQESQNGTDNYQYEKIIEYVNSAYGELMTCWMIASDIINGDSTDEKFDLASHAAFIINVQTDMNSMRDWLIAHGATQDALLVSIDGESVSADVPQQEANNESGFDELVEALSGVWVERSTSTIGVIYFQISGTTVKIDDHHFNNSSYPLTFFMFGTLEEGNGCAICKPLSYYAWPYEGKLVYEFSLDANGNLVLEASGDINYNQYDGVYDRVE